MWLAIATLLQIALSIQVFNTDCPAGYSTVSCGYILSNTDSICSTITSGVVNGESCSLDLTLCNYYDYINTSSTSVLCEEEGTQTTQATAQPTTSCANYRRYSSSTDFSSTQGANGWYYGYYSGTTFVQFANYGMTPYTGGYNSWYFNSDSNGLINSLQFMPNAPASCNTPSFGTIAPVLRWYNPANSCYHDMVITLTAYQGRAGGDGVALTMKVNGNNFASFSNSGGGALSVNNQYIQRGVHSIELKLDPINGCDYDQTTYELKIAALGASSAATVSARPSTSSRQSTSPVATSSLLGIFSYNMCASSGTSVVLPYSQSYANIITNAAGSQYLNNAACQMIFYKPAGTIFSISFTSFNTEECCDFLRIIDSTGLTLMNRAGITIPTSVTAYASFISITFTTDSSVISTGVGFTVQVIDMPSSSSPISTADSARSRTPSAAPLRSASPSASLYNSVSSVRSASSVGSHYGSLTAAPSSYNSASPDGSHYGSLSPHFTFSRSFRSSATARFSYSSSPRISSSPHFTYSASYSSSHSYQYSYSSSPFGTSSSDASPSTTSSQTALASQTPQPSVSASQTPEPSVSASQTPEPSMSASQTPQPSVSASQTPEPSVSTSPLVSNTVSPSSSYSPQPLKKLVSFNKPPALPANLSALSSSEILGLFTDLSDYNPLLIKDALKDLGFAGLGKSPDGVFAVSTEAFDLKMKRLAGENNSMGIGQTNISLPIIAGSSAASAIQWATNPYSSLNSEELDVPVLSLSVLDTYGREIPVNNLSTPIVLGWTLPNDERFQDPPEYIINCVKGDVYISQESALRSFKNFTITKSAWNLPCTLGTIERVTCLPNEVVHEFTCPTPILNPSCMYWNTTRNVWSTDGCKAVLNGTYIECHCTHLTDFSTRINAVADQNKAIFDNAGNVYSLEGLEKYASWYGIFGGIALFTLGLACLSARIDFIRKKKYIIELYKNKTIQSFIEYKPKLPLYRYSKNISYINDIKKYKKPVEKEYSLWQRICAQHTRLQFIFRYDPRLSRIFRLMGLFVLQFHSLFITALLYGFTYNGTPMMWYDSIILALITSALNIPMIRILVGSMNIIGLAEFENQFPYLTEEYKRRAEFEALASVYFNKQTIDVVEDTGVNINDSDDCLNMLAIYLCCRESEAKDDISILEPSLLLKKMTNIVQKSFVKYELASPAWSILPCNTFKGFLFLACSFGWLGWCLNYLLLFSAAHEKGVGEKIMISYATSEMITVVITQPITICASLFLFIIMEKYSKYIPFYKYLNTNTVPSLYYFSNPWRNSKSVLTSEFAYAMFIECAAHASGVNPLVYAPTKAIISSLALNDVPENNDPIKELYTKFIKFKINLDTNS